MSGRNAFWALVAAGTAFLVLLVMTIMRILDGGIGVPAGYILTRCGQTVGALYTGEPRALPAVALLSVLGAGSAAGVLAALRMTWITRSALQPAMRRIRAPEPALAAVAAEVGLGDLLVVSDAPGVFSFCYGLLRPRVCVSSQLIATLETDEIRALLAHEHHHLQRRDPLKSLIAETVAATAFALPLMPTLHRAYRVRREIDADRAAIAAVGYLPLVTALRKTLSHPGRLALNGSAAVGGLDSSGARLSCLLDPETAPPVGGGHRALASFLIVGLLLVGPALAPAPRLLAPAEMALMSREPCAPMMQGCGAEMAAMSCCFLPILDPRSVRVAGSRQQGP